MSGTCPNYSNMSCETSGAKQRALSAVGLKQGACAGCQGQRESNELLIKLLLDGFSTVDELLPQASPTNCSSRQKCFPDVCVIIYI